jgi:hypothetical protein
VKQLSRSWLRVPSNFWFSSTLSVIFFFAASRLVRSSLIEISCSSIFVVSSFEVFLLVFSHRQLRLFFLLKMLSPHLFPIKSFGAFQLLSCISDSSSSYFSCCTLKPLLTISPCITKTKQLS